MNTKKISLYLLIAFLLSWSIAAIIYFTGLKLQSVTATVLLIVYMYMPALSAFIVQKLIAKEPIVKPLRISFRINRWFLWALLIPPVLVLLATLVGFLFPGVHYTPDMSGYMEMMKEQLSPEKYEEMQSKMALLPINPFWLSLIQGFVAAVTINALAAFGEELGWRGFLLAEFRNKQFVSTALIIGFIWGIWHAPIILMGHNYPQHPQWGVLFMVIFCILYTFLFNYISLKAKSVIAATILHGSINAFAGLSYLLSSRASDLLTGIMGAAGIIVLFTAVLLLFVYDRWISKESIMNKTIGDSL